LVTGFSCSVSWFIIVIIVIIVIVSIVIIVIDGIIMDGLMVMAVDLGVLVFEILIRFEVGIEAFELAVEGEIDRLSEVQLVVGEVLQSRHLAGDLNQESFQMVGEAVRGKRGDRHDAP
jgi:hypothetical protein